MLKATIVDRKHPFRTVPLYTKRLDNYVSGHVQVCDLSLHDKWPNANGGWPGPTKEHILEVGQPGNFLPMMLSAPRQPRERV